MRNRWLKGFALMLLSAVIFSCGEKKPVVTVFNWGDYIDETILADFEDETGIRVRYETFATNEDMYVKLKQGGQGYDVIIPSDYMVTRLIREEMVQKIDRSRLENSVHLDPRFLSLEYDPSNEYTVPYFWGTLGILYNKSLVNGAVTSWGDLWRSDYEGEVLMMESVRDSMAAALQILGYSINTTDPSELEAAGELLKEQKPLVLAYVGDNVKDMMIGGEAAIAMAYNGDAVQAMGLSEDLEYIVPSEGGNLWVDCMMIPAEAKNSDLAYAFIDYMNRPDVAAKNTAYIGYSSPNLGAKALMDSEIRENRAIFPSEEETAKSEVFVYLGEAVEIYNRIWTEVKVH